MKKILLTAMTVGAVFFGSQNMKAQETETETEVTVQTSQDEYTEVDVENLPQAVKDAIGTDYKDAVTEKAWVKTKDEEKIYKLSLNVNGETQEVYIDQDGKWLEDDDDSQK
ncbi:hypothetical protein C7S20_07045 [Christiangramia fulva]|uniref:Beta-lactamase-inhibitor-like PepSY-like domain-containing protein n=1 Tax=Christiangramia fulva TaxID=2126553 RepID=A0A2R3Z452_9FLAO|nr:hypothetical protein [Christiangramia fulva]AVR45045.1 hypothetical protein C7S20_07045 [Christiangramia fulva]